VEVEGKERNGVIGTQNTEREDSGNKQCGVGRPLDETDSGQKKEIKRGERRRIKSEQGYEKKT